MTNKTVIIPTVDQVIESFTKLDLGTGSRDLVGRAIDMTAQAFRVALDNPSEALRGEVRQGPERLDGSTLVAVRLDRWTLDGHTAKPWTTIYPDGSSAGRGHEDVKGWKITGAVPGTPAGNAWKA